MNARYFLLSLLTGASRRSKCTRLCGKGVGAVPLIVNGRPDPLGNNCRVFIQVEHHRAFKSIRAGDQDPHSAAKWISRDPSFVGFWDASTANLDGGLDPLPASSGDSLAVEDERGIGLFSLKTT
jgi:hypothetical protein